MRLDIYKLTKEQYLELWNKQETTFLFKMGRLNFFRTDEDYFIFDELYFHYYSVSYFTMCYIFEVRSFKRAKAGVEIDSIIESYACEL